MKILTICSLSPWAEMPSHQPLGRFHISITRHIHSLTSTFISSSHTHISLSHTHIFLSRAFHFGYPKTLYVDQYYLLFTPIFHHIHLLFTPIFTYILPLYTPTFDLELVVDLPCTIGISLVINTRIH